MPGIPIMPDQAATMASRYDAVFFTISGLSLFFTLLVFSLVTYFAIKYRRKSNDEVPVQIHGNNQLELLWSAIPLGLAMIVFVWSAIVYVDMNNPPADSMEIYVIGRQWMWKVIHPEGREEINELHVPVGRPVKLIMTSQDVIHSFFVPDFRLKQDAVPGRYTTMWFQATKPGRFHIFCTEYCGTEHSGMIGTVTALEPADYQAWLAGADAAGATSAGSGTGQISAAQAGELVFANLGCGSCHRPQGDGPGPSLVGVYGADVRLDNGQTVKADDAYMRESVLNPNVKIVAGYQGVMPAYQGRVSEDQLNQLLAYMKSLGASSGASGSGR